MLHQNPIVRPSGMDGKRENIHARLQLLALALLGVGGLVTMRGWIVPRIVATASENRVFTPGEKGKNAAKSQNMMILEEFPPITVLFEVKCSP